MWRAAAMCMFVLCGALGSAGAAVGGDVEAAIGSFLVAEAEGIERARAKAASRFDGDAAALYQKEDEAYAAASTPLHTAAQDGNLAEVKALVEAGADIDAPMTPEWNNVTPLNTATRFGRLDVMEYLLREGADPDAGDGVTPLWEAAANRHFDAVKLLLEHGANPNRLSPGGVSPVRSLFILPWLSPPSRVHEAMRLLLEAGADPDAGDAFNPLEVAMNNGDRVSAQLLRQFGAVSSGTPFTPDELPELHRAARDGDVDTIKSLLQDGADINQPDDYGRPPAYFAAESGRCDVFEWLAEQGADLTIRTVRPVDDIFLSATMGGNLELLRICLDHGGRVDYPAMQGMSPLTRVVAGWMGWRDWNAAEFLIQNGADVNWRDVDGMTPLHIMAAAHLWEFDRPGMERLIRAGADRDALDKDGLSPLHYAAARNNRRAMALLMEAW